jgi:hypothetical protein
MTTIFGSVIVSRRIRSISALMGESSHQPVTSSTGCNWSQHSYFSSGRYRVPVPVAA